LSLKKRKKGANTQPSLTAALVLCRSVDYTTDIPTQDKPGGGPTVLTKTQLRTAKLIELERLKARIEAELEERREQEEQRKHRQEPGIKERLVFSTKDGHYQWEYRQCGHKERCKRCKDGKRHGPYLYRYLYRDGKYRSEYIKLSELAKHPVAPPRPPV
jgi:hypothetical protein